METAKDQERLKYINEWVHAADLILNKIEVSTPAHKIWQNVMPNSHPATPLLHPEKGTGLSRGPMDPNSPTLAITCFIEGDDEKLIHGFMEQNADMGLVAAYKENYYAVFIDATQEFTDTWKGLVLIHELFHADAHIKGLFRNGDKLDHWREEVAAIEMEIELACLLNPELRKRIDEIVIATLEIAEVTDSQLKTNMPVDKIQAYLDQLFGGPLSEAERRVRLTIFKSAVMFKILDKVYPDTAEDDKVNFTKQANIFSE